MRVLYHGIAEPTARWARHLTLEKTVTVTTRRRDERCAYAFVSQRLPSVESLVSPQVISSRTPDRHGYYNRRSDGNATLQYAQRDHPNSTGTRRSSNALRSYDSRRSTCCLPMRTQEMNLLHSTLRQPSTSISTGTKKGQLPGATTKRDTQKQREVT